MPLTGNLAEFPLPEVLLLIGGRTGRLRLFDAEEFVPMEIDLSAGHAHGLHIGGKHLTEPNQIVAELSFAVETGGGLFRFDARPIVSVTREQPLGVSELVMQLVLRVDEKLAKHRAVLAPELFYVLSGAAATASLPTDLRLFFRQSRQLLSDGVRSEDLSEYLGLPDETVRLHLYHLHQLGLVRLIETTDVEALRESIIEQEHSEQNLTYELACDTPNVSRHPKKVLQLSSLI